MTFEEAKAAAADLGTWVRARAEAQSIGGQDLGPYHGPLTPRPRRA